MTYVLFIHQAADLYGSDKVLLYIVAGLSKGGAFQPIVVLPERGPLWDALTEAGIEVHVGEVAKIKRSVFSPMGLLRLVGQLWRGTRQLDHIVGTRTIAVVHSNTLAVTTGAAWARWRRVPHLWHVHEIILSPRIVSRMFPLMLRLAADKVMSNSSLTERWLLDQQPALAGRSVVVFNGLPPQEPADASATARFRAGTKAAPDDLLVVLAGRLNHWKGQALLIEAAAVLLQRGQIEGTHFAIVGDTAPGQEALRTQLLDHVARAQLTAHFTFVPFANDIRPVWNAADIAVVPSTEPEPFGMVAIEAMAAARPVVAAAHGGLLEIVQDDVTGLLFEPRNAVALADALHALLTDPERRKRLGDTGQRRQREHFSAASQVRQTEQVYDLMIPPAGHGIASATQR